MILTTFMALLFLEFSMNCHELGLRMFLRFINFRTKEVTLISLLLLLELWFVFSSDHVFEILQPSEKAERRRTFGKSNAVKFFAEPIKSPFLFNTFNTLYGISLEFPQRTPDLIMKVSQLMRYQLESNAKQCVTLEEELSFINSYIQLEKERVGYRCEITYECTIDNENTYKISPMLLIAFVENAFKHGTCAIENCFVHIKINIENGKSQMNIVN